MVALLPSVAVVRELMVAHQVFHLMAVLQTVRPAVAAVALLAEMVRQLDSRVPVADPVQHSEIPEVVLQAVLPVVAAAMQAVPVAYKLITEVVPAVAALDMWAVFPMGLLYSLVRLVLYLIQSLVEMVLCGSQEYAIS